MSPTVIGRTCADARDADLSREPGDVADEPPRPSLQIAGCRLARHVDRECDEGYNGEYIRATARSGVITHGAPRSLRGRHATRRLRVEHETVSETRGMRQAAESHRRDPAALREANDPRAGSAGVYGGLPIVCSVPEGESNPHGLAPRGF